MIINKTKHLDFGTSLPSEMVQIIYTLLILTIFSSMNLKGFSDTTFKSC